MCSMDLDNSGPQLTLLSFVTHLWQKSFENHGGTQFAISSLEQTPFLWPPQLSSLILSHLSNQGSAPALHFHTQLL